MKNMAKASILFMVALLIATFATTGSVLATETCQEYCSLYSKSGDITIAILPDANNNQWPVVVNEAGSYRCDDPSNPNSDNYPCLAWPYQCIDGPCEKITKGNILIPNCCDKPIEILWTSHGDPSLDITTCDEKTEFPNVCSGYQLLLPNNAGSTPGLIFWFTTPEGIGTNMIDITVPIQSKPTTCLTGIKGPGCNTPIPPVRVEPRVQCYQFIADTDNCQPAQTWYAKWAGTDPCAVDVWVADGIVACSEFPTGFNLLTGQPLSDIKIVVGEDEQLLTEALTNNSQCSEGWLRFTDPATGCNVRCYYSGGRRYCR
ncbi:MAG: hypothetical protein U9R24_03565 [Thermodesulfobacteriota bacterium]|nr:hypothetical protein [Thermodesulfobacteriota bacterium]